MKLPVRIPARLKVNASTAVGRVLPSLWASRIKHPHMIVSSGRSGTTLLNGLFDLHPEVANFPSEANELWHPGFYPWERVTVDVQPFFVDPQEFTRRSLAARTHADDRHLLATFGAFQTMTRAPVLLLKNMMVTFMLDRVLELLPGLKLIHMVRDGRAVAQSWVIKDRHKLDGPRMRKLGLAFSDDSLLDLYAANWVSSIVEIERIERQHQLRASGRFHELKYEHLCRDPKHALAELAGFMGVSAAPFVSSDLSRIKSTNEKSRSSLDPTTLARLNERMSDLLVHKGYDPDQVRA